MNGRVLTEHQTRTLDKSYQDFLLKKSCWKHEKSVCILGADVKENSSR